MRTEAILRFLYDLLVECYPGIELRELPADLKHFLANPPESAVALLCNTRTSLDRFVGRLVQAPTPQWSTLVETLSPKERFFLLDRLLFAFRTLCTFRWFEMKERRASYWSVPELLADVMTSHYKKEVVVPCLSSGKPPFYFEYFGKKLTLRRHEDGPYD